MDDVLQASLPSHDYTDAAQFTAETTHLFSREWMVVARTEELAEPGGWRVFELVGESLLLLRGPDGTLRGFFNVCRHRGARLCPTGQETETGRPRLSAAITRTGLIRCPYHGWVYGADGRLIAAPFLNADTDLDPGALSLYPVGCREWGGFIFVHLEPATATTLEDQIAAQAARISNYPLADLRVGHRVRYQVHANWKILCENYNECYHCGPLHPELCALVPAFRSAGGSGLAWERGIEHREGATTFTWTGRTTRAAFPGLNDDERQRHKGELLYPNLFLSLAADHVAAFILRPQGPAMTWVDCLYLFSQDELARPDFDHTDASSFWEVINQQDWAICESVQQGMGCRAHVQGFYAPMEDANLDMRRYILERMTPARAVGP